ncbi:hypothetical protein SAMN02746041_02650 [Desulfacinum hydrothermale DSM 13146]|uniref:O-antigen ligase n=1 Tax=Desulfacinum hydrothermale DSM 13146 TaxID=1121390 RepID=A0A1W1XRA1_9BACT|nr:hypothetical protein [Desulfacinum hydrothermale]SMC26493.1 hypothetical protein SAMN02746041_02650 [Desulfacinum hydrothermale DSM 13146]
MNIILDNRFCRSIFSRRLWLSVVLGVALGTGYMTSLRFWGPLGLSEILFCVVISVMLVRNFRVLVRFERSLSGYIKVYLLFTFLLVLPVVTSIVYFLSEYSEMSSPEYIASWIAGVLLAFLLAAEIRENSIDMRLVSSVFFVVFVAGNIISMVTGYGYYGVRYKGFANNPNQLVFYLLSVSLLLALYYRKLFFAGFPVLFYIGLISGSDDYKLSVAISIVIYFYLVVFYWKKASLGVNVLLFSFMACVFGLGFGPQFAEVLMRIWHQADEGGARIGLMVNALQASAYSPLFGWGAGSFSGLTGPFEGWEGHNNLLDLSMQFGFLVPVVIYGVFAAGMVRALGRREYLVFSVMAGFVVAGLFHFSARHFVFWVEFGVFLYYVFYSRSESSVRLHRSSVEKAPCVG